MIERIFEHARKNPERIAAYHCGHRISYRDFAYWIAYARQLLSTTPLAPQSVAVIEDATFLTIWAFGIALRSLGVTTAVVPSLETSDDIGVRNVDCVLTTRSSVRLPAAYASAKVLQMPDLLTDGKVPGGMPDMPRTREPAGGHILFTSGTTGTRKKIFIDEGCLCERIPRYAGVHRITESSVFNLGRAGGWAPTGYSIPSCVWSVGGAIVFHQAPDLHKSLAIEGITHTLVSPAMLAEILRAPANQIRRHEVMRLVVGGGPLPPHAAERAASLLTPHLFTAIGSTEVGTWAVTKVETADDLRSHSVYPAFDVQIVDQADRPLPPDQMGTIRIRLMDNVRGYLDDEDASRAFFRHGYFYTGDLATIRADGRLVLHGRLTNVINRRGSKIASEPIEQRLAARWAVDGVCLLSMPGNNGEELNIVVEAREPVGEPEFSAAIREELSGFPAVGVHYLAELPRNEWGKVDRVRLQRYILHWREGPR